MTARTALVVDDSKSARFALRRYLEGHQFRVDAAESAAEAMNLLARQRPEVIFLDDVMPGVDGFEALRVIKARADLASIPVVICSSNEGPAFNAQARAVGATAVLQKPPNPEQLTRILDRLAEILPVAEPARQASAPAPAAEILPVATFGTALEDALVREQVDTRLRKVSQGLVVQFAEMKATIAHLANQQVQLAESPNQLRGEFRGGLDETQQALRLLTARLETLERETFAQLTVMRTQMEALFKSHSDRVSEIVQFARQTAAEEAQVVAERTVMSAALRISDQLSDAILGAIGRR